MVEDIRSIANLLAQGGPLIWLEIPSHMFLCEWGRRFEYRWWFVSRAARPVHSFITRIYIAPLQGYYSEVLKYMGTSMARHPFKETVEVKHHTWWIQLDFLIRIGVSTQNRSTSIHSCSNINLQSDLNAALVDKLVPCACLSNGTLLKFWDYDYVCNIKQHFYNFFIFM